MTYYQSITISHLLLMTFYQLLTVNNLLLVTYYWLLTINCSSLILTGIGLFITYTEPVFRSAVRLHFTNAVVPPESSPPLGAALVNNSDFDIVNTDEVVAHFVTSFPHHADWSYSLRDQHSREDADIVSSVMWHKRRDSLFPSRISDVFKDPSGVRDIFRVVSRCSRSQKRQSSTRQLLTGYTLSANCPGQS